MTGEWTQITVPELCETCTDARGWIWPTATNGLTDHSYVERCDACERFADDLEAARFVSKKLGVEFKTVDLDFGSGPYPRPYIDGVVLL